MERVAEPAGLTVATPTKIARRALLRAAGLVAGAGSAPGAWSGPGEGAVFALARRRRDLLAELARVHDEDEVARLCERRDALAAAMGRLPTPTLAAALVKLAVVREEYVSAMPDGVDERLLDQALLTIELEVRRKSSPHRNDPADPA